MSHKPSAPATPSELYAQMAPTMEAAAQAHAENRLPQALALCGSVLDACPDHVGALHLLVAIALQLDQPEDALALAERVLGLHTTDPAVHVNRGSALYRLGRFDEALQAYDRALALNPQAHQAWFNRANTLKQLGQPGQACLDFERAVAIHPHYAEAFYNWGNTLHELGRFEEACQRLGQAIDLAPQDAQARKNCAFAHLMLGQWAQGWDDYEWRWKTEPLDRAWRDRGCPQWSGRESLHGRTILLHAEQGLGDTLQFCRYARLVKRSGAALVILEVQKPLVQLLSHLEGPDLIVRVGDVSLPADFHSPLMSLPRAFATTPDTVPAEVPYLRAEPERISRWRGQLPEGAFNIGICWEGSAKGREVGKAIPLSCFAALAERTGVVLHSLQKVGQPVASADFLRSFGGDFDEDAPFVDTAAVMMALDLVITTDTSVAHLAGALGVPVWVALPRVADWRWLAQGSRTPWYPTMRLFRQSVAGNWAGCFQVIAKALDERLSEDAGAS
jgi:tetratricopeptide (TPR) repeat protein